LVKAGVASVVAAMRDPDPRVDGKGFDILRAAGIEVTVGCLSDDAERLNEGFLHWHRTGLPFVTLKAATTLDGRLSARDGESRWISSEASRTFAHRLRWEHDAILVGAGTVRRDNPSLTVRLGGAERRRPVVVLSASGNLDPECKIFKTAGPQGATPSLFVYTSAGADLWSGRAHVGRLDPEGSLSTILRELGAFGIRKLLVEGGGQTFRHFLDQDLVQRLALFQAPLAVGGEGSTPLIGGLSVPRPADGFYWRRQQSLPLDGDLFTSFLRADAPTGGR
jgi:diaminohydroxyphosphoribosylaminopyrimidine deaminase/5-amino-6-(5-phosphoribosylamino)uracil reductase